MEGKPQFVAAIDVGTTKIVTLLGKRNENKKLEIVGFTRSDSKGIRRGEVLNPEDASNVIRDTVMDLQKRTGIIFSEVFVGIAGQHIRVVKSRNYINRPSYDESITSVDIEQLKSDANNIALDEGKEIIHILPQSFIVDNETDIFKPIGMLGKRLEANFNIVVGNSDSIKRINKCVHQAGLTVRDIILEPLASSDAVLYDEEREAGVALVDIGGGTTDVAVFYDNVLRHSAVIPYGGFVVTKDIKEACGLNEQTAEDVKIQFGAALSESAEENKVIVIPSKIPGREPKEISFRNLAHIIQARMEEIIDAIMFEIENSGCADKLGCGIVITGGGAMLRHLKELFCFRTSLDVRIGYPGEHLAGESENINEPCYATGVGLLLKGFNFMDEHAVEIVKPVVEPEPEPEIEEPVRQPIGGKEKKQKLPRKPIFSFEGFKDRFIRYIDNEPDSRMEDEVQEVEEVLK
jgi:cell division protein FtsA